jgi:hypothetical protein
MCLYLSVFVCMCLYLSVYVCMCLYVSVCVCMCLYLSVCVCMCLYVQHNCISRQYKSIYYIRHNYMFRPLILAIIRLYRNTY